MEKRSSNCMTAAMLEIGMTHEATLSFTHEQVEQYCALSGDRNAIHSDPEAARLRFPGASDIVVPGGLIQITITGLFGTVFPGDGSLGLVFSPDRFRKPVHPGDSIQVRIEITRMRAELIELDVVIKDHTGVQIGVAKSRVMAPDESYRAWWQQRQSA